MRLAPDAAPYTQWLNFDKAGAGLLVLALLSRRAASLAELARGVPVVVAAVLFGLAHAAGGWQYVVLATVAGAAYALAYARTHCVEAAVLTHFLVNALHFVLFTYPFREGAMG